MRRLSGLWDQNVSVNAGERYIQPEEAAHHAYQPWWRSVENRRFSEDVAGALVSEDSQRRGERRAIGMRITSTKRLLSSIVRPIIVSRW